MVRQIMTPQIIQTLRNVEEGFMPEPKATIQFPATLAPADVEQDGSNVGDESNQDRVGSTISSVCRVSALNTPPTDPVLAGKVEGITAYIISFPWDTVVQDNCKILYQGSLFEILGVIQPKSYLVSVKCVCKKLS